MDRDDLYGLPLDRFVPERNALAKALRTAGDREQAAEVAALRKPSVAAWAVNQLVRTQRREMDELLEAGDGLRDAHERVLAGRGDGRTLRVAVERERSAVDALTDTVRGLLTSEGGELSQTVIDRVADTLDAAALEAAAREQVREGRLVRELRHVGLGGLGSVQAPAPVPRARRAESRGPEERGRPRTAGRETARGEVEAARARAQAQATARAEARAAERETRRQVERATRAAAAARERRDRAAQALTAAQIELDHAEADRQEAQARLRDAEEAVRSTRDGAE
jgi:hypothetical protein